MIRSKSTGQLSRGGRQEPGGPPCRDAGHFPTPARLLDLVHEAQHEHEEEEADGGEDRNTGREEFPVDERPRDQKDHLDIKENEEHRGDVELHREAGVCDASGLHATLVGAVLDRSAAGALAQQVAHPNDPAASAAASSAWISTGR
jgi:hypothetical protein